MSILKVILYSTQDSKSLIYIDTDGVMTLEIERVYTKECDIACLRTGGARIKVSGKTRDTLLALEQKYDQSTKFHIRNILKKTGCANRNELKALFKSKMTSDYNTLL